MNCFGSAFEFSVVGQCFLEEWRMSGDNGCRSVYAVYIYIGLERCYGVDGRVFWPVLFATHVLGVGGKTCLGGGYRWNRDDWRLLHLCRCIEWVVSCLKIRHSTRALRRALCRFEAGIDLEIHTLPHCQCSTET